MTDLTVEVGLLGDITNKVTLCTELLEVLKSNDIINDVQDNIQSLPEPDSFQITDDERRQIRVHFNYFHGRSENMDEKFEKMDVFIVVWPAGPDGMLYFDSNFAFSKPICLIPKE